MSFLSSHLWTPGGNNVVMFLLKTQSKLQSKDKKKFRRWKAATNHETYVKYLEEFYHNCMRTPDCRSLDTYYFRKWQMCPAQFLTCGLTKFIFGACAAASSTSRILKSFLFRSSLPMRVRGGDLIGGHVLTPICGNEWVSCHGSHRRGPFFGAVCHFSHPAT